MMRAIHPKRLVARDTGDERTSRQLRIMNDLVLAIQAAMLDRAGDLLRNIHNESPAERDIHQLVPTANGKERLPLPEGFIDQHQLKQIPIRFRFRNCLL